MAILRRGGLVAGGPVASASVAHRALATVIDAECLLAPLCAVLLLLYPHPLAAPAGVVGFLPSAARWVLYGRPWRATPFDLALVLLVAGAAIGYASALDTYIVAVRGAGFLAGLILFIWLRESLRAPRQIYLAGAALLGIVVVAGLLVLHVAAPFVRLDRVPPLAVLAGIMEPLAIYRPLVDDAAALQRFRFYASGVGALAACGLALAVGLAVATTSWYGRILLAASGLFFGGLLLVSDSRGSILAGALTLGVMAIAWRPRLFWLVPLFLFGTFDLIALGLVQRGLDVRTIHERLEFWSNGLALAAETPLTGVGLGVQSVLTVYRAVYQPSYPPFFHTHNIFVQGFLEQGVLGLIGLLGLTLVTLLLGVRLHRIADRPARGTALAAFGGVLALLSCGLTEVVALTTLGWALLCATLGLLVAAAESEHRLPVVTTSPPTGQRSPLDRLRLTLDRLGHDLAEGWHRLTDAVSQAVRRHRRIIAAVAVLALVVAGVSGLWRVGVATVALNVGTSALYRGTLAEGASRGQQGTALAVATDALDFAVRVDPTHVAARRNLALALAAAGDRDAARRVADEARAITPLTDQRALFGVGRAYVAIEAWVDAISVWEQAEAGPQLLRLGDRLRRGRWWPASIMAYQGAARRAVPGRSAVDGISRTSLAHNETPDQAVGYLLPLAGTGIVTAYQAQLQIAQVRRQTGDFDGAWIALLGAASVRRDAQLDLEQALLLISLGRVADAKPLLRKASTEINQAFTPLSEGSDPRYWLAYAEAELGRHELAVEAARRGLADLPQEQALLRGPFNALLGDSLLALGRAAEALTAYQEGQRASPNDRRFADGIARARAALQK